jgi:hypothetical protein
MKSSPGTFKPFARLWAPALALLAITLLAADRQEIRGEENVLKNAGFEDAAAGATAPHWSSTDGAGKPQTNDKDAHEGKQCLALPAHTGAEQTVENLEAGAYVARCWVKSEASQSITLLLQNAARPWAVYSCTELQVPSNQWVQLEAFCDLDQKGSLTFMLGGTSAEFRLYHGTPGDMTSPILVDDCRLFRSEAKMASAVTIWEMKNDSTAAFDWPSKQGWSQVDAGHAIAGTPVFRSRHIAGAFRKDNGGLMLYAVDETKAQPRGLIEPSPAFAIGGCALVSTNGKKGIHVTAKDGAQSYTAWINPKGVISIEGSGIPKFVVKETRMRYGLLPSFIGTDICYDPAKLPQTTQLSIPSTEWFVGLIDGHDSMLVAVWPSDSQTASLGLSGEGTNRVIDSLSIGTEKAGFSLSLVEHAGLWHDEALKEDWLSEYTTIDWQRPFPARWMGHFFVSPGSSRSSFREPRMNYSFPIANTKTRLWGVWFEGWNHHPFFFDGPRTVLHFEKTFVPQGNALIYFLEPAAADLYSPCEIAEEALWKEKAAALFDFDGNRLRQLKYSTPDEFAYDRPVCATTTRLSKIKQDEKENVGINLVTHLYEFIREIRGRVDQYSAFFDQLQSYLQTEKAAHPEMQSYLAELEGMVADAKNRSRDVYATALPVVQQKTDSMKKQLLEGKGDGFNCGNLDVRGPAGAQDDLCRRYNRLVILLAQTAALKCDDSPQKAMVAKHIWDESRSILRRPTRWEPRRTLYFFEP